jgi:prepilin-type N-terminal cleavage/methylation domain-containing protein
MTRAGNSQRLRRRTMKRNRSGFTLIELLVAVGLGVILMSACAMIFYTSTEVFSTSQARMTIYANARASLDWIHRDLSGCLPKAGNLQRFILMDSTSGTQNKDEMVFSSTTSVNGTLSAVQIWYHLMPENDPELLGDNTVAGVRTGRPIYRLVREINALPVGGNNQGVALANSTADLCHYVVGFNVEVLDGVYANTTTSTSPTDNPPRFYQLNSAATRYRNVGTDIWNPTGSYPLGSGADWIADPTNEPRIPIKLRVTMRIIEGAGERQERLLVREYWIPMS